MREPFDKILIESMVKLRGGIASDRNRWISLVQDLAVDYPQERMILQNYADRRYINICMEASNCDICSLDTIVERASAYLKTEKLLDGSWAEKMSRSMVTAVAAYYQNQSIENIRNVLEHSYSTHEEGPSDPSLSAGFSDPGRSGRKTSDDPGSEVFPDNRTQEPPNHGGGFIFDDNVFSEDEVLQPDDIPKKKSRRASMTGILIGICILIIAGASAFFIFGNGGAGIDHGGDDQAEASSDQDNSLDSDDEQMESDSSDYSGDPSDYPEDFIFPYSDSEYLGDSDVSGLNYDDTQMAINEIYARRNVEFEVEPYASHFNATDWYDPSISFDNFDSSVFNKYENANIDLLAAHRTTLRKEKITFGPEADPALEAYNEVLSGESIYIDGFDEYWDTKNCKFALALIDDDGVPELVVADRKDPSVNNYGVVLSYDGEAEIVHYMELNDAYDSDVEYHSGYYEGTGYVIDYCSSGEGYDQILEDGWDESVSSSISDGSKWASYVIRRDYYFGEETKTYLIFEDSVSHFFGGNDNCKKVSKEEYYDSLNPHIESGNFKTFAFHKNTKANRSKYLNE